MFGVQNPAAAQANALVKGAIKRMVVPCKNIDMVAALYQTLSYLIDMPFDTTMQRWDAFRPDHGDPHGTSSDCRVRRCRLPRFRSLAGVIHGKTSR